MSTLSIRSAAATLATMLAVTLTACETADATAPDGGDGAAPNSPAPTAPAPNPPAPTAPAPSEPAPTAPAPSTPAPTTPAPSTPAPDNTVPSAVVGAWRYGAISPTNFWNDHTGVYSGNAYGMSDQYEFAADGTFTEYVYIYTQSYGCRTQVWVEMRGRVQFDETSFTKRVASGRFKTADTCAASRNFDRAMTQAEAIERSKSATYAVRADASGKTYLQILDGRYDRAQ
jgi:hypothetical protein